MPIYYGIDYYYLVLVVPAVLISLIAQIMVKSSFSKYSKVHCSLTGAEAARRVLEKYPNVKEKYRFELKDLSE